MRFRKQKDGEVDVILVHSKAKEEEFVESGYGVERFQVMYNDFVIVGPKDGPIAKTDDINAAFKQDHGRAADICVPWRQLRYP